MDDQTVQQMVDRLVSAIQKQFEHSVETGDYLKVQAEIRRYHPVTSEPLEYRIKTWHPYSNSAYEIAKSVTELKALSRSLGLVGMVDIFADRIHTAYLGAGIDLHRNLLQ